jgi:hypothetical protein
MKADAKQEIDCQPDELASAPVLPPISGTLKENADIRGLTLLNALLSDPTLSELKKDAREFLLKRSEILRESQPACRRAADAIGVEYTSHIGKQGYEGLPYVAINRIFSEMLQALPPDVQETWFNLHSTPDAERTTMFKVFSWSFNRVKEKSAEADILHIKIKERGEIGGEPLPYPSHTHIDVPFCLRALGFSGNQINIALAAAHDSFEEGASIRKELDKIDLAGIDLAQLVQRFPENKLGMQLAVGIPTLTETEYLDLAMALPNEKIEYFENFVRPLYRSQL